MKKNNGRRRHRGFGRRNITNINKNTVLESCGPLSQVRGNALQLNEKYSSLASDAASNDDKVLSECYLQFADHYYRLNKEIETNFLSRTNENGMLQKNGDLSAKNDITSNKDNIKNSDEKIKPSRKERSDEAKKMELQLSEKSNFQEKIPRKFSEKKLNDLNEIKN